MTNDERRKSYKQVWYQIDKLVKSGGKGTGKYWSLVHKLDKLRVRKKYSKAYFHKLKAKRKAFWHTPHGKKIQHINSKKYYRHNREKIKRTRHKYYVQRRQNNPEYQKRNRERSRLWYHHKKKKE